MKSPQIAHDYYEEICQEHGALREQLGKLQRVVSGRLENVSSVATRFVLLSEQIELHFSLEEISGLFEQIVFQASHLSSQVDDLRSEHQQLLVAIRQLSEFSMSGDDSSEWWQCLEDSYSNFRKELMQHESREMLIFQQAYCEDIGGAG
jgi:iron-sulfur cluster repair protein YtfE (RIC family)